MALSSSRAIAEDSSNFYNNSKYHFSIDLPKNFVGQGESENGDGQVFKSVDGIQIRIFGEYLKIDGKDDNHAFKKHFQNDLSSKDLMDGFAKNKGFVPTYKIYKKDWYVISGNEGNFIIYKKAHLFSNKEDGSYINNIIIAYPKDKAEQYKNLVKSVLATTSF